MINSIKIFDIYGAIEASRKNIYDHRNFNAWISINDIDEIEEVAIIQNNIQKINGLFLSRFFRDIDFTTNQEILKQGPDENDVIEIIYFLNKLVQSKEVFNLGINCYAGARRSPAVGFLAWILQGEDLEGAMDKIYSVRPFCEPNNLILFLADKILKRDTENSLFTFINRWNKEK